MRIGLTVGTYKHPQRVIDDAGAVEGFGMYTEPEGKEENTQQSGVAGAF